MLSPWMPDLCLGHKAPKKLRTEVAGVRQPLQNLGWTTTWSIWRFSWGNFPPLSIIMVGSNHCTFLFLLQPTGSSTTPRQLLLSQGNHMTTLLEGKKTKGTDKNSRCQNMLGFLLPEKLKKNWKNGLSRGFLRHPHLGHMIQQPGNSKETNRWIAPSLVVEFDIASRTCYRTKVWRSSPANDRRSGSTMASTPYVSCY